MNSLDFRPLAPNGFKLEVTEWDRGCWNGEDLRKMIFTVVQLTVWSKVHNLYLKEGSTTRGINIKTNL